MAGGRLVLPATDPVFNSSGLLNVGATLIVYDTGTTTPASIFADVALTEPIANPQTSDSAGRFYDQGTQICADITQAYDIVLTLTDGEVFTYTAVYALGAAPSITGYAPIDSPHFTGVPTAPTPAANDSSSKIATTAFVTTAIAAASVVPPGQVGFFGMTTLPTGWLLCDGSAISRTTYGALFAQIGTVYGVGNGTTTFNLPDYRGYFLRGLNTSGSGVDPSRALGVTQAYSTESHSHLNGMSGTTGVDNPFIYATSTTGVPGLASKRAAPSNTAINIQGTTSTFGGTETRPVNLAIVIAIHT